MVKLSTLARLAEAYVKSHGDKDITSISTVNGGSLEYSLNLHDIYTGPADDNPYTGSDSIHLYDEAPEKTHDSTIEALAGQKMPSHICIAYAVLEDNDRIKEMNRTEMQLWVELAENISEEISRTDEARFTLYDYLDACLNGKVDWLYFADRFHSALTEKAKAEAMKELILEAEEKRTIYSMTDAMNHFIP